MRAPQGCEPRDRVGPFGAGIRRLPAEGRQGDRSLHLVYSDHQPQVPMIHPGERWIGAIAIELPRGVLRHPQMLDDLVAEIGRFSASDESLPAHLISLCYYLDSSTADEAWDDSVDVSRIALAALNLKGSDLVLHRVGRLGPAIAGAGSSFPIVEEYTKRPSA